MHHDDHRAGTPARLRPRPPLQQPAPTTSRRGNTAPANAADNRGPDNRAPGQCTISATAIRAHTSAEAMVRRAAQARARIFTHFTAISARPTGISARPPIAARRAGMPTAGPMARSCRRLFWAPRLLDRTTITTTTCAAAARHGLGARWQRRPADRPVYRRNHRGRIRRVLLTIPA